MISKDYVILAAEGMHARPATTLIRLVKQFKSTITLKKGEKTIQMNSMLNILSLSLKFNDTVTISIDGEDETEAAAAMDQFFIEQLKDL